MISIKEQLNSSKIKFSNKSHPYHILTHSYCPFFLSFSVLSLVLTFVVYFNYKNCPGLTLLTVISLVSFILTFRQWVKEIWTESGEGHHTEAVTKGFRIGFILFICTEIMFFFSFFWGFFHFSLSPAIQVGNVWPPLGIETFSPWKIPLLNTLILLTSGITVTVAHLCILDDDYNNAWQYLAKTIFLGIIFLLLQYWEYNSAGFSISDSAYGSIFFLLTGFHGFHVLVGTIFLLVVFKRLISYNLYADDHVSFELASWYWHFVDVVWIFLYTFVYIWSS